MKPGDTYGPHTDCPGTRLQPGMLVVDAPLTAVLVMVWCTGCDEVMSVTRPGVEMPGKRREPEHGRDPFEDF